MKKMNKKGGEKYLSLWWVFIVIVIVGGGIILGVFMFYGGNADVRALEANSLLIKVKDCLNQRGFLIDGAMKEEFDILKKCGLEKEAFIGNSVFYLRVSFFNQQEKIRSDIRIGNFAYEQDCEVAKGVKAEKYPRCIYEKIKISYFNDGLKESEIEILAASNQEGGRLL